MDTQPSSKRITVIGVDPGPVPGIVVLRWQTDDWSGLAPSMRQVDVVQCSHMVCPRIVASLATFGQADVVALALEQFITSPRTAKSSTPVAGYTTRSLVTELSNVAELEGWHLHTRRATDVKPWAISARLARAGLIEATEGMRHARDAARHALFCSVHDYGMPDPLSKKAATR